MYHGYKSISYVKESDYFILRMKIKFIRKSNQLILKTERMSLE